MPDETEFAQTFQEAHENLEDRQRKRNIRRNNGETDPSKNNLSTSGVPDMQWIIEALGFRKPY